MAKNEGENSKVDLGIASFVLSLVALSTFFLFFPAVLLGIVGLVFGIIQYKRNKSKFALWGIILSVLSLLLILFFIVKIILVVTSAQAQIAACSANPDTTECQQIKATLCAFNPTSSACTDFPNGST